MRLFILFIFIILAFPSMNAQIHSTIPSSGSSLSGSGGNISYSLGQLVFTTYVGTNGTLAQGVHQPYEISVLTGIEETCEIDMLLSVFPNPALNDLTLKVESLNLNNLSYQLFDFNGKILDNQQLIEGETNINMANFSPSTYILQIKKEDKIIKTFKILKN